MIYYKLLIIQFQQEDFMFVNSYKQKNNIAYIMIKYINKVQL